MDFVTDCLCLPIEKTRVKTRAGLPMSTNWKDTSQDSGGIAYVYRLEEHELQFDPCHWPAYEDNTFQAGTDKSMHLGGRR